jgi:hypothetical protein
MEKLIGSVVVPDWFTSMDTNKNGVIDPLELDDDFYDE